MIRAQTLTAPVMHPVHIRIHHWFIPNRLLWDEWEDFRTKKDPDLTVPQNNVQENRDLYRYMGANHTDDGTLNALPLRAYNTIYNEFYRDQDLTTERTLTDQVTAQCSWEKDYFTTARDVPQQGDAIEIPFSVGRIPIIGIGKDNQQYNIDNQDIHETGGIDRAYLSSQNITVSNPEGIFHVEEDPDHPGYPGIYGDLSGSEGGIDVNDLRRSIALQRFAEARARYGSRYTDYLRYLGVRPSDARLGRPEFLGGGKQTIGFSEVLNTAGDNSGPETAFVGDMAGHGIASCRTRPWRRFFEEDGYVMSLLSVRPKTIYEDHTERHFLRSVADDYWTKELEVLPTQPVFTREIHPEGGVDPEVDIFGYQNRYAEYRRQTDFI